MLYTFLVWLYTAIVAPILLVVVLGLVFNDSELYLMLESYELMIIMIIVGGILSIPAMIIFWLILQCVTAGLRSRKIILSFYGLISVVVTFYFVDPAFITDWPRQTLWVLVYALTLISGIWIFRSYDSKSLLK